MTDETSTEEPRKISIFELCETDTDAEENGRWFNDIFEDTSGIDVKLRRMTSKASMEARRRLDKQYRGKMNRKGEYDLEFGMKVLVEQMAEGVIVDWRGVYDREGNEVKFTKDNAIWLMGKLPTFRDAILINSQELDNFRIESREDAEKN